MFQSPLLQNLHKNYNYTQITSSANTQDSTMSSNSQCHIDENHPYEETEKRSGSSHYIPQRKFSNSCGQEGDSMNNDLKNINSVTRNLNCFYNCNQHEEIKEQKTTSFKGDSSNCSSNPSNQSNQNNQNNPNSHNSNQQWQNRRSLKYPHDDHTAMELHRSKSYIVNLIDRALSRELGTIPEERTSKQVPFFDTLTF